MRKYLKEGLEVNGKIYDRNEDLAIKSSYVHFRPTENIRQSPLQQNTKNSGKNV